MCLLTEEYGISSYPVLELQWALEDYKKTCIPIYIGNREKVEGNIPKNYLIDLSHILTFKSSEIRDVIRLLDKYEDLQICKKSEDSNALPVENMLIENTEYEVPLAIYLQSSEQLRIKQK